MGNCCVNDSPSTQTVEPVAKADEVLPEPQAVATPEPSPEPKPEPEPEKPKFEFAGEVIFGEDKKSCRLSLNRGESSAQITERFINENSIDPSLKDQVTQFVEMILAPKEISKDYTVEDGRKLKIMWNAWESAETVAVGFATYHGKIKESELAKIIKFIEDNTPKKEEPPAPAPEPAPAAAPAPAEKKPDPATVEKTKSEVDELMKQMNADLDGILKG